VLVPSVTCKGQDEGTDAVFPVVYVTQVVREQIGTEQTPKNHVPPHC